MKIESKMIWAVQLHVVNAHLSVWESVCERHKRVTGLPFDISQQDLAAGNTG